MARLLLNPELLEKLERKTGKSKQRLRETISRKASKLGVSSLAAQLILAQEIGLSIAGPLNKLPPEIREEVRNVTASTVTSTQPRVAVSTRSSSGRVKPEAITSATLDLLLQDPQLRDRCKDLLKAKKNFDRVIREATTVLEDRLKKKSTITNKMNPADLVGRVLSPDPKKAIIEVSTESAEQEGFHGICKGIMLVFRNQTHHELSDKLTQEDALKVCAFIDSILDVIEQAQVHLDRV